MGRAMEVDGGKTAQHRGPEPPASQLRMAARLHQSGGRRQRHFPCLKRIAGVPGDRRLSAAAASLTGSSARSDPWSSRVGLSLAGLD